MPKPSHRLDLILVPTDPDRAVSPDALRRLARALDGVAGARGTRADLPDAVAFYGNQQGGFRVRCPETGDNLVPDFGAAMRAWRAGGSRALPCPHCGDTHPLEALDFAPAAAFARGGVVLVDVATATVPAAALEAAAAALGGPVRVIGRRTW